MPTLTIIRADHESATTEHRRLSDTLARLGEAIDRDGVDAHAAQVAVLAGAVRRHSPAIADVLSGRFVAPMRERALARAVRMVLQQPADHPDLAGSLTDVLVPGDVRP